MANDATEGEPVENPTRDPKLEEQEIERRVKDLFKKNKPDHDARVQRYKKLEEFITEGKHWKDDDDPMLPNIPIGWYYLNSINAKISKKPFEPRIVPEEATDFPQQLPDFIKAKQHLAQVIGERYAQRKDNEVNADIIQSIVDYYADKTDTFVGVRKRSRYYTTLLGVSWIHNGLDEERQLFGDCSYFNRVMHPKDVIADTEDTTWNGNDFNGRFVGIRVPMTWKQAKKRWADKLKDQDAPPVKTGDKANKDDKDNRNVDVWLIWLRDRTVDDVPTVTGYQQIPVTGPDGFPQIGPDMQPVMQDDQSQPIVEILPTPRWEGGWIECYFLESGEQLLSYGENSNPSKKLPLHRYPCFGEGDVYDHGFGEKIKSINFQQDRFIKYILDNAAATGQNVIIEQEGAVVNPKQLEENKVGRRVTVSDITKVQFAQGLSPAEGFFRTNDMLQSLGDLVTGVMDLRQSSNMPVNASGRYVESVEGAAEARISEIAANERECFRSLIRDMAQAIISTDEEEKNYKVSALGSEAEVKIAPKTLDFSQVDFESPWDVAMDGAPQEATDPAQRNQDRLALLDNLLAKPPEVSTGALNLLDLPNRDQYETILKAFYDAQQQRSQAMGASPEDQAKAAGQMAKDFSQAMQSISQDIATHNPALGIAVEFAAIPMALAIAQGQSPNLDGLLANVRNLVTQLQAMGLAPVAQVSAIPAEQPTAPGPAIG